MSAVLEHEFEPVQGLPQVLPRGEHIVWQGQPEFASLAVGSFHAWKLAAYFAALLVIRAGIQYSDGVAVAEILSNTFGLVMLSGVAIALLLLYSARAASSSIFTITNKRIVIRTGVAVSVTVNLPFKLIEAADLRLRKDGSGDIALGIDRRERASYVLLWPMVKPFRWLSVRPVLRGIPDAESVAALLAAALSENALDVEEIPETSRTVEKPAPMTFEDRLRAVRMNWPLAAVASLIVMTVVGVSMYQLSDARLDRGALEPAVASIQLRFVDREDGGVDVFHGVTGERLETVPPETNGFLRGTLRSLVRGRKASSIGPEIPFEIRRTESGRILLHDPATETLIDLRAFGPTNVGAFARFLDYASGVEATAVQEATDSGVATVAQSPEE